MDERRVQNMRFHIIEQRKKGREPYFSALTICRLGDVLYVVDGQHRLKAIKDDYEANKIPVPINLVIYHVADHNEMAEIFETINKGVPIPNYIKQPNKSRTRETLLREIETYVSKQKLFGQHHQRPYVNTVGFMNALAQSRLIRHIETVDHFATLLQAANKQFAEKYKIPAVRQSKRPKPITQNMWNKCVAAGIYIGLDEHMEWIDTLFELPATPPKQDLEDFQPGSIPIELPIPEDI